MFPLECNGWIATVQYETVRREPEPTIRPYQGNLRNRLTRAQWAAYLRACDKVKRSEPQDMAPQGMVPFGMYPGR